MQLAHQWIEDLGSGCIVSAAAPPAKVTWNCTISVCEKAAGALGRSFGGLGLKRLKLFKNSLPKQRNDSEPCWIHHHSHVMSLGISLLHP